MKLATLLPALLLSTSAFAQQQGTDSLKKHTAIVKEDYKDDWAALHHYAEADKTLPPPAANENRVVFLGSSIFEFWKTRDSDYFNRHKLYIDRGISGQISPQLLIRFQQDVINLKPKAVIILAGSNDIGSSTGHITYESIMNNVKSMVELAKLHHIKVILCEYLPINAYPDKIVAFNKIVKSYAAENNLTLLDYWTPLADDRGMQKPNQTIDGTHPNVIGYKIMEKVTDEAIAATLNN